MAITARLSQLSEIESLRELYREEMNCQIIHDSIHGRPGWTTEYSLELDSEIVGYGSVAIAGPWSEKHTLYEFYVHPAHRMRTFDLFASLLEVCSAKMIETQSNDHLLAPLLHTFTTNMRAESILFEDAFQTSHALEGAAFRNTTPDDAEALQKYSLDSEAKQVVTLNGEIAGTGGVLYHYNRPYGDIYMHIAEPFRRRGLGAYLVQELKAMCRAEGTTPAARCNIANLPSRKTLQKAGFVPCGNIIAGDLPKEPWS